MPTYQDYLNSIKDPQEHFKIRKDLMLEIEQHTGRYIIVYATDFRKPLNSIEFDDKIGFSDLIEGFANRPLDILINSPGGSPEATEDIVRIIRSNFKNVRFIVPNMAMSAATMMCLSGNWILMDERGSLGPIDPQIRIQTREGIVWFPGEIIIEGFNKIQEEIKKDPNSLPIYLPWLSQYGPYVPMAQNAIDLSKELSTNWLRTYMFENNPEFEKTIINIVSYLSDHSLRKSHGRPIKIEDTIDKGFKVKDLREEPKLRELIWKLWCNISLLFDRSPKVKIFENAHGVNWGPSIAQQVAIQIPTMPIPPQMPPENIPKSGA